MEGGDLNSKMASRNILTLYDVQHAAEARRKLLGGSALVQQGYKVVM